MGILTAVKDKAAGLAGGAADRFLTLPGDDASAYFAKVKDDVAKAPSYALETIAVRGVEVHGAAASRWLAAEGGADASNPEKLAQAAVDRTTRVARVEGAALGIGGFLTVPPDLATLTWLVTREVVFVAAAYGRDPADPARAAEMLAITGVYDDVPSAQAALDRRGERLAVALAKQQVSARGKVKGGDPGLTQKLVRFAGVRVAQRYGGRFVPGVGAVLGAIDNGNAAKRVGERAIAFYAEQ